MREIKFRAWNSDFNWFEENFFIGAFDGCGYDTPGRAFDTPNIEIEEQPNYIIEQFTGLKDCNGTDIYEGDIISDHVGIGFVEYGERYAAFRVNYKNGRCKWFYDYLLNGERGSIEVIGNIHQNPEPLS